MPRLSYANVMSTIAVFLALGGTSYAVAVNSIGERQLRKGSVTSAKVRDGTLQVRDLAASLRNLPARGPRGPQGPPGASGGSASAPPEAWQPLTLVNGWTSFDPAYETPSFRREGGRVYLRGLMTLGSGLPAGGMTVGTLPPGYRPSKRLIFVVRGLTLVGIDVLPSGELLWYGDAQAEKDFTGLDGISFAPE
jgi:hypothetical protein